MTLAELSKPIVSWKNSSTEAKFVFDLYQDTMKHYRKQHRDWYINERFVRWEHWIVYNKTLNKVQPIPTVEWEVRRTINKIRTQVRWVKNFIKKSQPRWNVSPDSIEDSAYEEAKKYNTLLQNFYDTRQMKSSLTSLIVNALKFSAWIMEVGIVKKNWKDYLDAWVDDTFDILYDPLATNELDARYVIKAVRKSITAIRSNPKYNYKGEIVPDNKDWASEYKDLLEKEKYNKDWGTKNKDLETVILLELWMKHIKDWEEKIKKITVVWNQVIQEEETTYSRFPFFIYNPEWESNQIYSDAWIKDLISPNKSLDKTVSQIESYIQRMLAGKYLIKNWVEVSTITDRWAEKIYYKGNVAPIQQTLQPLPSSPFTYANSLERWIEEAWGTREASLWRASGSLQSGRGLEALQLADASTVAEPIENLELFLARVWEFILEIISKNQFTTDTIVDERTKSQVKYIGNVEHAESLRKENPEITIIKPKSVIVRIVPEISYSEESKKETIMRLSEAGLIDQETLLEYLNISNVSDIIARVEKKNSEKFKQEIVKQNAAHATGESGNEDTADLADQENTKLMAWEQVALTPEALWMPEHLQLHEAFVSENKDQMTPDVLTAFWEHIDNERSYWGNVEVPQEMEQEVPQEQFNQ